MKYRKVLIIYGLLLALMMNITACGGSNSQTEEQLSSIQNVTDQQATVEQVIPKPDPSQSVDSLIGNWIDINAADNFATITKVDKDYQYEDKDDKYPATFKDGVLTIKVSDSETAEAYYYERTKHLFLIYQNSPTEFKMR